LIPDLETPGTSEQGRQKRGRSCRNLQAVTGPVRISIRSLRVGAELKLNSVGDAVPVGISVGIVGILRVKFVSDFIVVRKSVCIVVVHRGD
jgi:hypothetical protein